jgi:P2-related tail formation protein
MPDNRKLMASAVADSRLGIFDGLISQEFDDIDLSPIMCYLVDVVDRSALPWLAVQFDVDGFKGYDLCVNDNQRRELIKNAISLHRHIGTVWGIKKACEIIGFPPYNIEEGVPVTPGGPNVWCAFRVEFDPSVLDYFTADTLSNLRIYINYYKNARSILAAMYVKMEFDDKIFITEEDGRDTLILSTGDFNDDFNDDFNNPQTTV